jgi:hypothetical protein
VVELLHYLVRDGPIEWHEIMVKNVDTIAGWVSKTQENDTKLSLVDKIQNWAALQADGPFAQGYNALLGKIASLEGIPNFQSKTLACEDLSLSRERVAQEVTQHSELVTTTCGLFVETLNFNQGYIGNNDLARDLHSQCKDLKLINDKWLQRNDLNEGITDDLYLCSIVIAIL